jgi:hypothetical protein
MNALLSYRFVLQEIRITTDQGLRDGFGPVPDDWTVGQDRLVVNRANGGDPLSMMQEKALPDKV